MKYKLGLGIFVLLFALLCACSSTADTEETGWLTADELKYQGITVGETTLAELQEILGEENEYIAIQTPDGMSYYLYAEDNTEYYSSAIEPHQIIQIIIRDINAAPIAKGIKIGDSLSDILKLLPNEPQSLTYTDGKEPEEKIYLAANEIWLFVNTDEEGHIKKQTLSICTENIFPLILLSFNESANIDTIQIMSENI